MIVETSAVLEGEKPNGKAVDIGEDLAREPEELSTKDDSGAQPSQAITTIEPSPSQLTPRTSSSIHLDAVFSYAATLPSDRSRRAVIESVKRIARLLHVTDAKDPLGNVVEGWKRIPWAHLTARETSYIVTEARRQCAPETAKLTRSMLRGILRSAWRLGHMPSDQYMRAADMEKVGGSRISAGRALSKEEVTTLRAYVSELPHPYSAYVWAVFMCGLGGGLRRDEIARLVASDVRPATTEQKAAGYLRVLGKGNKERLQPLPKPVWLALQHWLAARSTLGLRTAALFPQLFSTGQLLDASLSERGVWRLVTKTGKDAGIAHFSPHDLRRTFATRMFDRTDLSTVQDLMGHADPKTTIRYDHRGDAHVDASADLLNDALGALDGAEKAVSEASKAEARVAATADVLAQVRRMAARGYSVAQIATALRRAKIRKKGGTILTAKDVERLIA